MAKTYKTVALLAPTINEVEGLKDTFPRLPKGLLDEIIVIDLNSTDGTLEYCKANGYRVHHQQSRGYGASFAEGADLTTADIIVEFLPDGSSLPEKIPELLAKIDEGYDLVIASRYKDGAKSFDDDKLTRIGNWLFTKIINTLFNASYTDTLVGFRAYRRSTLDIVKLKTRDMSWTAEQCIHYIKAGLRVAEIGADEPARVGGIRKMRPFKTGWRILKLIIREFVSGKKFA